MADFQHDGVTLAYQQMGEGPDLVFVHGLAASRAFWFLHYAVPLSRYFRVTLFDLRGHGYSSMPPDGYDPRTMAGDLLGLLAGSYLAIVLFNVGPLIVRGPGSATSVPAPGPGRAGVPPPSIAGGARYAGGRPPAA